MLDSEQVEQTSPCHRGPLLPASDEAGGTTWRKCGYPITGGICGAICEPVADRDVPGGVRYTVADPSATDEQRDHERDQMLSWARPLDEGVVVATDVWEDGRRGITYEHSWGGRSGFGGIPPASESRIPNEIEVGDRIRLYAEFGSTVAGLDLLVGETWENVYFLTEAERKQRWAKDCENQRIAREIEYAKGAPETEAEYAALPEMFKRRIDGYRERGGVEWRVDFERYEMFTLTEATKIANYLRTEFNTVMADYVGTMNAAPILARAGKAWPKQARSEHAQFLSEQPHRMVAQMLVAEFANLPHEQQKPIIDDGHSGNTFGCACRMATLLLSDDEQVAIHASGAMAPLVGSAEYKDASANRPE